MLDHGRAREGEPLVATRAPMIGVLVIEPLMRLAKKDPRWTETLLWQQDQYTKKAIHLYSREIQEAKREAIAEGRDPMAAMREKIVESVQRVYVDENGFIGRRAHADMLKAAETLLEVESQVYADRLQDLEELLAKAIANGDKFIVEQLARHAYVAAGRLEAAEAALRELGNSSQRAVELAKQISRARSEINFVAVADSRSPEVGRELKAAIAKIDENPTLYIAWQRAADAKQQEQWKIAFKSVAEFKRDNDNQLTA